MAALFHVNIVVPDRLAYEADVSSLVVPAENGYLGVLAHHAPIIALLKPGKITLRDANDKTTELILKSAGVLEFSENKATIMLDSLESPA